MEKWKSCSKPPSRLYHCISLYIPSDIRELSGTPPRSKEPSSPGLPNLCLVVSSANSPKLMKPQMGIWNCWAIWMGNTGGNDKFNGSSIESFMDYQWDKHGQTNHISSPAAGSRVFEGSILVFLVACAMHQSQTHRLYTTQQQRDLFVAPWFASDKRHFLGAKHHFQPIEI